MSNNKGCNPFGGCIVTIICGFVITVLLIGAIDSCAGVSSKTSNRAAEGLIELFMTGNFFVACYALFSKD